MGNTISASNPTEVRSIESYLGENCENIENLGSTRFMKAVKARGENGYLKVYKMFIKQDDKLDITKFQDDLLYIGKTLSKEPNCLPVRIILNKGKDVVLLVRSYQKYTLFDRLSTRPFINDQERIWYIYQLFKALEQCQKAKICHGDLKSQNVLLSSANWLQITDFASFKPPLTHADNPSLFSYFFDTTGRQHCHLAPERLVPSAELENVLRDSGNAYICDLTPEMDMFSAGCIVYEILCDGKSPFVYGAVASYKMASSPEAAAIHNKLGDDVPQQFRPLVKLLLNREPQLRLTAKDVLNGVAFRFPPVLEWLYKYLETFRSIEIIEERIKTEAEPSMLWLASYDSDYVISKLLADEELIFKHLNEEEAYRPFAVLIISLITCNLRNVKGAQNKVQALRLLVDLSRLCDCTVALERILPYYVYTLSDPHVTVRVCAIHCIKDLLQPLEPSSIEQSLIFMDYLLPEFNELAGKDNIPEIVVQTLAANLGFLAECAFRFHIKGWELRMNRQDEEFSGTESIDQLKFRKIELSALGKAVADLFQLLITKNKAIRHCLINPDSLAALSSFFNSADNKDDCSILVRHLIAFLNSKDDWRLRAAVFDALPICLQKHAVDICSLLEQGLHDFEELVVLRVLHCIHTLIAEDLLEKQAIVKLLKDVAPFLAHPNKWIRTLVVDILVLLDSRWSLADIHSKLLVEVSGYFKCPMLRLNSKLVITKNLKEPIPRPLWKHLISDLTDEQMKTFSKTVEHGGPIQINEPWYRKINRIEEDNNELKWKLYKFRHHYIKMVEFKKSAGMEAELTMSKGKIDLSVHEMVKRHEFDYGRRTLPTSLTDGGSFLNNQEWNDMAMKAVDVGSDRQISSQPLPLSCDMQLQRLLSHKDSLYLRGKGAHLDITSFVTTSSTSSKISGNLLTHLHEHQDKVTKIVTTPEHQRVVTVSFDGSIKVWSGSALVGEGDAVKSEATLYIGQIANQKVRLKTGAWMNKGQYFTVGDINGEVNIVDLSASKEKKIVSKIILPKEDGPAEEIHTDNNIIYIRTHHGVIYCLDRRIGTSNGPIGKHEVWRRTVSNNHGLIASSCIDPWKSNWMVLSVTNNRLVLWDLRYQQEVSFWATKKSAGVPVKLWNNPCSSYTDPQIFCANNIMGDIGIYDIARGTKSRVLWSSLYTPLTYSTERGDIADTTVTGALCVNPETGEVYTGDTQGALRKWNLKKPHYSDYLSGMRKVHLNQSVKISYQDIIVKDGDEEIPVIREYRSGSQVDELNYHPPTAVDAKGATCHRTSITDIACLGRDLLISASADGVIKVWK